MKKVLSILCMVLMFASVSFAQLDVDTDNNDDIDVTYGGTNVSALNLIRSELTGLLYMKVISATCTIGTDCDSTLTTLAYGGLALISGDYDITLPAVVAGMSICVYNQAANEIQVIPNGSDGIILAGAARDTDGDGIRATDAAAGDYVCLFGDSSAGWTTLGTIGTWAD